MILGDNFFYGQNLTGKLLENTKVEIENDTIFVAEKSKEKALKKFYRIKNKQEKKLNDTKLIEINIISN